MAKKQRGIILINKTYVIILMPPPPHPLHPPHKREKFNLIYSAIISLIIAAIFFYALNVYGVPLAGAVPAAVALWVGLVAIVREFAR